MKTPVFIRIYKNDQLIEVKQFTDPQVIIGSGDVAHIRLQDTLVSTIHCLIEERESGYFICDLGSQSGTFKNGTRVLDSALESGDQIRAGESTLEFFRGVPKPAAPPKPSGATKANNPVVSKSISDNAPPPPPPPPEVSENKPGAGAVSTLKSLGISENVKVVHAKSEPAKSSPSQVPKIPSRSGFVTPESKKGKTFAPPSEISDLGDVLKPTRGTVIEVVTAWRERVLDTYHLSERKLVTLGGGRQNDIVLPVFGNSKTSYPLIRLDAAAIVYVRLDMGGLLRKEKQTLTFAELMGQNRLMAQPGGLYGLALEQGESVRVDFPNEVSVYIRYVNAAPKPTPAPFFDFTSTELTGFVMSLVLTAILGLYMALYTPPPKSDDQKEDDVVRTAVFLYKELPKPPPPPPPPPPEKKEPQPIPKEDKPKVKAQTDKPQGKAAEIRPKKLNKKAPKTMTSVKQGGEIKTGEKDGANAKAVPKKDITKTGLLGVFGSKGAQNELDQSFSGAGELQGLANSATGSAGSSKNRPGEGLGAALKDTGAGGKGTATVGIAGIGTNGNGFGRNGYGTGGLGEKTGTLVIPGGAEESFDTQIDREAIRRVVRSHLREIQYCYERELNQDPNLSGKVLVTWVIGAGGKVLSAGVTSSTIGRKSVGECIVARLQTWRFPEPPADKQPNVTYPFLFQKN